MNRNQHILTMTVDNEFGVLTRITALIRREGWNIRNLAVGQTLKESESRLTIELDCFDAALKKVLDRIGVLDCVKSIYSYDPSQQLIREMAILRIAKEINFTPSEDLASAIFIRELRVDSVSRTLEITAEPYAIDALIASLPLENILDFSRSGAVCVDERISQKENML